MFNNNTTATCPQSVPVKNFENRSIFDKDMDNHKVGHFFETQCILPCSASVTRASCWRNSLFGGPKIV